MNSGRQNICAQRNQGELEEGRVRRRRERMEREKGEEGEREGKRGERETETKTIRNRQTNRE